MAKKILWSGSTTLPAPTSLSVNDEIIWTSDTGRTLAGLMVGAVVAQKKNLSIKWEFLTEAQVKTIKNTLVPGFFPFSFRDDGIDITIQRYAEQRTFRRYWRWLVLVQICICRYYSEVTG